MNRFLEILRFKGLGEHGEAFMFGVYAWLFVIGICYVVVSAFLALL